MSKNKAAADLARRLWRKKTKAQRSAHARKMAKARWGGGKK